MKILIAGATGSIGKATILNLMKRGFSDIRILTRDKTNKKLGDQVEYYSWNPQIGEIDEDALKSVDVIINLAGENIASKRWSKKRKQEILDSRIKASQLLIDQINKNSIKLKKYISASAIGIYGNGFLNEVCKAWEGPILNDPNSSYQKHILRIGIVLMRNEGAISQMLPVFKLGLGGMLGDGTQYMSWIHIDDLIAQIIFLIENDFETITFDGVSPSPVTNAEFTSTFAKVLNKNTFIPVPKLFLKIGMGELSEVVLESIKVYPNEFINKGFTFKFKILEEALVNLLNNDYCK